MHYLVTGATGYLGGFVTAGLLAGGHTVTALVPDPDTAFEISAHGVRPFVGSVVDPEAVRRALAGVDGVFHLSGHRRAAHDAVTAEALHVDGARTVVEAALAAGVAKVVYTGTLAALGDTAGAVVDETHRPSDEPRTPYEQATRRALEVVQGMVEDRQAPVVVLLTGVVYGPLDTGRLTVLLRRYLRGRVVAVPSQPAYCWARVEDSAWAHLAAMERGTPGETFIVGGEPASVRAVVSRVARLVGRTRPPYPMPGWALAPAGAVLRPLATMVPRLRGPRERLRAARGVTYLGDDTKAGERLGWRARSLDQGLPDHVEWLLRSMLAVRLPDAARGG